MDPKATERLTLHAMLVVAALALSAVERWFPLQAVVPIPGIKLGLPNVVTLFALFCMDTRSAAVLLMVRVLLSALLFGSPSSLIFSAAGGLFALGAMRLAMFGYPRHFSVSGVSVAGALAHNTGQVCAAVVVMGSTKALAYLPMLAVASLATGLITGTGFYAVCKKLRTMPELRDRFVWRI